MRRIAAAVHRLCPTGILGGNLRICRAWRVRELSMVQIEYQRIIAPGVHGLLQMVANILQRVARRWLPINAAIRMHLERYPHRFVPFRVFFPRLLIASQVLLLRPIRPPVGISRSFRVKFRFGRRYGSVPWRASRRVFRLPPTTQKYESSRCEGSNSCRHPPFGDHDIYPIIAAPSATSQIRRSDYWADAEFTDEAV